MVVINAVYPETYPDAQVHLNFSDSKGLRKKALSELMTIANSKAEESLGEACLYDVCSDVTDWLKEHNQPEKSLHEEMMERLEGGNSAKEKEMSDKERNARVRIYIYTTRICNKR